MASYVYLITNLFNNKCYLGKTNNKMVRWSQHKSKAKVKNSYFYNALKKYGTENFSFEILKECETEAEAYEYERVLIELFELRNKKYGYNTIEGGSGGSKGYKVSDSLKKYFSEKYVGALSVRAKFCDEEVISILDDYSTGQFTTYELSKKYGCGKSTLIRIVSGISYADVKYDRTKFKQISVDNKKKKSPKGNSVSSAKLSDVEVSEIRKLYTGGAYSYQQLANKYNVSKTNIYYIVKNKSRKPYV